MQASSVVASGSAKRPLPLIPPNFVLQIIVALATTLVVVVVAVVVDVDVEIGSRLIYSRVSSESLLSYLRGNNYY